MHDSGHLLARFVGRDGNQYRKPRISVKKELAAFHNSLRKTTFQLYERSDNAPVSCDSYFWPCSEGVKVIRSNDTARRLVSGASPNMAGDTA